MTTTTKPGKTRKQYDGPTAEELVAELASVLIAYRLQIGCQLENHAAYPSNWAELLKEEPKALFKVLSQARQAADLIAPESALEEVES